jgi:hypothetical protein
MEVPFIGCLKASQADVPPWLCSSGIGRQEVCNQRQSPDEIAAIESKCHRPLNCCRGSSKLLFMILGAVG